MDEIVLNLILSYLKEKKYIQTFTHLQTQSKVNLRMYPKEIEFFKKIIMRGDFNEAIKFITTFEQKIQPTLYKEIILNLYKQKLYELIENPEQLQLRNLFEKELIHICSQDEYQQLFTLLTCKSVKETAGMAEWTVMKGRYNCFEEIVPHIQHIFPQKKFKDCEQQFTIEEAVKFYLQSYQEQSERKNKRRQLSTDKESVDQKRKYELTHMGSEPEKNRSHHESSYKHSDIPPFEAPNIKEISEREINREKKVERSQVYAAEKNESYFEKKGKPFMANSNVQKSKDFYGEKESFGREHEERNEENEDTQREIKQTKSPKSNISYLKEFTKEPRQTQFYQEQIRKNAAYLDPNNSSSVQYKEEENQNFTFSNNIEESGLQEKQRKILKLATVTDNKAIRTCHFSSSGRYFALGTNSSILKIYDIEDLFEQLQPKEIESIYEIPQLHSKSIFCLDWASNEKAIVTCSNDLTIKITQFPEYFSHKSHKTSVIGRHQSCIRMVKFNFLENRLISCGDDSLIKVWDLGKVKKCTTLKGHKSSVSAFKLSENQQSTLLYSVSKDSTIRKWDLRVGECVGVSAPQDSEITYIANNIDNIVVSHKNGSVSFFNPSLQLDYTLQVHEQEIRSIDGLEYDETLLTASFDGHISLFNEKNSQAPNYHQHNENDEDKVVFATFLNHPEYRGFASTSTLGLCNIYCYE